MAIAVTPASRSYFSKRLRLHYLDWGNEGAPPLLMIHGSRDHCRNWDWMAERFRDDYHILAPDLRGHGDSQWNLGSAYALAEFVHDIAQLVQQTATAPVRIIAHSLGGRVAVHYAAAFPEQVARLVSIEGHRRHPAPGPWAARVRDWVDEGRRLSGRLPRRYASLAEACQRMHEANPHLSAEQVRHLTVHGTNQNEDGTYSWKFDNYVHLHGPADRDHADAVWKDITCPVLLISGAGTWASRAGDDVAAQLRDGRHEVVADAGHWVHHDQLDTVCALARDFLSPDGTTAGGGRT